MTAPISILDLLAGGMIGFGLAMILTGVGAWCRLLDGPIACRCQSLSEPDSDDERLGDGAAEAAWVGQGGPHLHHHHDMGDKR